MTPPSLPAPGAGPGGAALLEALPPGAPLPPWCDRHLPPARRDALGGRAWYDTTLAAGLPPGAEPVLALGAGGAVLMPLMRQGGALRSLTTPYSLGWRPLVAGEHDAGAMRAAGEELGRALRGGPPAVLDCLPAEEGWLAELTAGLRAAGLVPLRFDHFGNWHEPVTPEDGWDGYLSDRASALQSTIRRKTPRCLRRARFEWIDAPGARLEAGIAAYEIGAGAELEAARALARLRRRADAGRWPRRARSGSACCGRGTARRRWPRSTGCVSAAAPWC